MQVIGTAGHVDHGKSTLIHALTGIDPDRLQEEKARQMTIDLGFAWLTLPNGASVGVVDVPGHRDFIKNMLAGVGGIDAALFVVAADEGVMPQTREHLAILDLLGVEAGVIVLTKVDLLANMAEGADWLELVEADVCDTVAGTVLENAPILPVSAHTGEGLEALVHHLQEILENRPPAIDLGRPRLPIDRVFTISGFGTVVTGTLIDGYLEVGQEVEIQPRGLTARVRGLQTHKQKVERAEPGSRVAINLTGVSKNELARGHVVTTPGWLHPTVLVDVQLRYLPETLQSYSRAEQYLKPLRHNTPLKFYSGAAETLAHVRVLGQNVIGPGENGWAQLRLQEPIALVKGDRFIVRRPSPPATIGGGFVVDPNPGRRYRRFRPTVIERLETLAQGTPGEILSQTLDRRSPTTVRDLIAESGLPDEEASAALDRLIEQGAALLLTASASTEPTPGRQIVSRSWWAEMTGEITRRLEAYHQKFPLRVGMGREALRSGLKLDAKVFNGLMERAAIEGVAIDEGATVRRPAHEVTLSAAQQQKVEELLARFERDPYAAPSVKESTEAIGEDVLNVLLDRGELIQVSSTVLFLADTYREMVDRIRAYVEREGSITLAQTRDLFDTSRKYAQALLEYLDEIGATRRVGDKRILR
jgi:selenocysteine-specific elongation factor